MRRDISAGVRGGPQIIGYVIPYGDNNPEFHQFSVKYFQWLRVCFIPHFVTEIR